MIFRKKQFLCVLLLVLGYAAQAQVTEINPRADWKYVRSQELTLQDRSIYQFEFPADSAYEYLFNINITEANIETYISVADLQNMPIGDNTPGQRREQLQFKVPASGTYKVSLLYKGPEDDDGTTPLTLTLIRRPFVD